jgi:predicted metal-dependent hydrolase
LRWHAAEEIEHKCVAFDVLREVDPRWSVRIAGLCIATAGLLAFWLAGAAHLLAQDPDFSTGRLLGELAMMAKSGEVGPGHLPRSFLGYLRPGFHPANNDNFALAREFFAGRAPSFS